MVAAGSSVLVDGSAGVGVSTAEEEDGEPSDEVSTVRRRLVRLVVGGVSGAIAACSDGPYLRTVKWCSNSRSF